MNIAARARRWLNALLSTLKFKGLTTLATLNPRMHSTEEYEALLGLFDGELRITEGEGADGVRQILRICKLINRKYQEKELVLTKQNLPS